MAKKTAPPEENAQEPATHIAQVAQATAQNTQVSTQTDDFFSGISDELKGIYQASDENIDNSELQIARIGIVQPLSPEVANQVEGWKGGMLYDNVTRSVISSPMKQPWLKYRGIAEEQLRTVDTLIFVPIFKLPTEYVRWPNKEERAAGQKTFQWKTLDATETRVREGMWKPKGTWVGKGSPPVTEHLNIVGAAVNQDGSVISLPIVLSFSRTSYPTGKKFVTFCQNLKLKNLPWWGVPQYLYCDKITNTRNETYYVLRFATGPTLQQIFPQEVGRALHLDCLKLAKELSNPETGKIFQQNLINAAAIAPEESDEVDNSSGESDSGESFTSSDPAF